MTIDKRTGKAFEEGKHHKKSQKGNKKNPGKKGASAPAMKAVASQAPAAQQLGNGLKIKND